MTKRNSEEPKEIERLEFTDTGIVYSQGEKEHHIKSKYRIVSDETVEDTRIITMRTIDKSEVDKKMIELIDAIVVQIGADDDFSKKIIKDSLDDFYDETVVRLHKRVVEDKEPVKTKGGCLYLQVGKRCKDFINIRESQY